MNWQFYYYLDLILIWMVSFEIKTVGLNKVIIVRGCYRRGRCIRVKNLT